MATILHIFRNVDRKDDHFTYFLYGARLALEMQSWYTGTNINTIVSRYLSAHVGPLDDRSGNGRQVWRRSQVNIYLQQHFHTQPHAHAMNTRSRCLVNVGQACY